MKKNTLTLTIIANITSNYGENLGNISSVQKVFKNGKVYAIRSKESLKNAIMIQSGMYDDLQTDVDGATQKAVNTKLNATNCRALEGGYMNTKESTYIRKSSFYLTDAIAVESFINEARFHNNLYLANNYADLNNINLQKNASDCGLMPYQYEYDKSLKTYSITIDLDMIGVDNNFKFEEGYEVAKAEERIARVNSILNAIENLHLIVKGNLDNAEPIFVVGGISEIKSHYFENAVNVKNNKLILSNDLKNKISKGFKAALVESSILENQEDIKYELNTISVSEMFDNLREEVANYYNNQ